MLHAAEAPIGLRLSIERLLLLFRVQRVLSQAGAVFADFQLFATRFAADGVVVITRFFADEKDNFDFFLAFGHD